MKVESRLLEEAEFESKVLQEAAESLNFIGLLASAYRAPELLEFIEKLAGSLARFRENHPAKRSTYLNKR